MLRTSRGKPRLSKGYLPPAFGARVAELEKLAAAAKAEEERVAISKANSHRRNQELLADVGGMMGLELKKEPREIVDALGRRLPSWGESARRGLAPTRDTNFWHMYFGSPLDGFILRARGAVELGSDATAHDLRARANAALSDSKASRELRVAATVILRVLDGYLKPDDGAISNAFDALDRSKRPPLQRRSDRLLAEEQAAAAART